MLHSMTGYGKAQQQIDQAILTIEIKSLNSKSSTEIAVRLPQEIRPFELEIRKRINERLIRGKIDVSISIQWLNPLENHTELNPDIIQEYRKQLLKIEPSISAKKTLEWSLRLPDILKPKKDTDHEPLTHHVLALIEQACDVLILFRIEEGKALYQDISEQISSIHKDLNAIAPFESQRIEKVRSKLNELLTDAKILINPDRLEQELILYLEKYDINEEKVRLQNHLMVFQKTMDSENSSGKKLGFLAQEMGREINTIGSKANDFEIQHKVVAMKDALERIKEQLLNTI